MKNKDYKKLWLFFVHIKAKKGLKFNDLIDSEEYIESSRKEYIGAWANIIVKSSTINDALKIVPRGLKELGFELVLEAECTFGFVNFGIFSVVLVWPQIGRLHKIC